jgi:hypothetical protein
MLLGMVTFCMSLFYAANFPDPDVRHTTWVILSEAISLFSAVLLFTSLKDLFVLQFGESGGGSSDGGLPDTKSVIISFIRLIMIFWGVQFLLMKYRRTDLPLKAWGSIGGNVIAFAAIDSYGMIQQFSPFRDNPANAFGGFVMASFMVLCMCLSSSVVRNYVMTYEDGIIKEHEHAWNEQCKVVENQFAAICLGLLLSIVIRFSISGSLPAIWGSPHNKTQDEVWTLFGISVAFAVPVFAISMTVAALEGHKGSLPAVVRSAKVVQLILSMTMGWSLTFCGQWQFWSATKGKGVGLGDKMTARMVDALVFSYLCFFMILILDFVADKLNIARTGFNAVSNSFVLGLGIAWQGAFSEAVNALSHRFDDKTVRAYMDVLITICLIAVVMPAWLLYMLPKALAGPQPLEEAKKPSEEGQGNGENAGEPPAAGEQAPAAEAAEAAAAEAKKPDFCAACGTQFEEGGKFCQNCGAARPEPAAKEPEKDASANTAEKDAPANTVPSPSAGDSAGKGAAATPAPAPAAGGNGGKAAASGGKGGRGSVGKTSAVPSQPAPAAQTWDDTSHWDGQQESWEQADDGWGGGGNDTGANAANDVSF